MNDISPSNFPVYLLGIKIIAAEFKESVAITIEMKLIGDRTMSADDVMGLVRVVYANTSRGDALRQVLVDHHEYLQDYANQRIEQIKEIRISSPTEPVVVPVWLQAATIFGKALLQLFCIVNSSSTVEEGQIREARRGGTVEVDPKTVRDTNTAFLPEEIKAKGHEMSKEKNQTEASIHDYGITLGGFKSYRAQRTDIHNDKAGPSIHDYDLDEEDSIRGVEAGSSSSDVDGNVEAGPSSTGDALVLQLPASISSSSSLYPFSLSSYR